MIHQNNSPILFNGVDILTVEGLQRTSISPHRFQNRNVTNTALANYDGSSTSSAWYSNRILNIGVIIAVSGRELMDASIAHLRKILQPLNMTVIIPIEDEVRELKEVTLSNFTVGNIKGGYCEIDIELTCADPFSYDLLTTELLNALNLTSGDRTYPIILEGTANLLPIITITIDNLTLAGSGTITLSNANTGQTISLSEEFTAGMVVVVDCLNKTVEIDNVPHDFDGNFLAFSSSDTYFRYRDDFTARQVDVNITYTKRYL